jgi:hypothetical protein
MPVKHQTARAAAFLRPVAVLPQAGGQKIPCAARLTTGSSNGGIEIQLSPQSEDS